MDNEIWKVIPGHEDRYEISTQGRLRNVAYFRNGKLLYREAPWLMKLHGNGRGYIRCVLREKSRSRTFYIHRLVLSAFYGPCPEGFECAHLNGNREDNRINNLAWVSPKENISHKIIHGTQASGEDIYNAKFSNEEVKKIKKRLENGERVLDLAKEYNVWPMTISKIKLGYTWKNVA